MKEAAIVPLFQVDGPVGSAAATVSNYDTTV